MRFPLQTGEMATIFKHENGQSIIFSMPFSDERQEIVPLIQDHGGVITSRGSIDIRLAVTGKKVHSEGLVSTKFIRDCIEKGVLLDSEKYKIHPEEMVQPEDIEDITSNILNVCDKGFSGRKAYLLDEDMAILKYLLDNDEVKNSTGNKVWKDMEDKKTTSHSWQSMRSRFRQRILPNIKQYVLKKRDIQKFLELTSADASEQVIDEEEDAESDDEQEKRKTRSASSGTSPQKAAKSTPKKSATSPQKTVKSISPQKSAKSSSPRGKSKNEENSSPEPSPKRSKKSASGDESADTPTRSSPQKSAKSSSPHEKSKNEGKNVPEPSAKKSKKSSSGDEGPDSPTKSSPQKRNIDESPAKSESEDANSSMSSVLSQPTVVEKPAASDESSPRQKTPKKKSKKPSVMNFLQSQSQGFDSPAVVDRDSDEENTTNGNSQKVAEAEELVKVVKEICKWLDLTEAEFLHVLYSCNGSVSDAVNWIFGENSENWSKEDDDQLFGSESHDGLREKYGSPNVNRRLKFLTDYLKDTDL